MRGVFVCKCKSVCRMMVRRGIILSYRQDLYLLEEVAELQEVVEFAKKNY